MALRMRTDYKYFLIEFNELSSGSYLTETERLVGNDFKKTCESLDENNTFVIKIMVKHFKGSSMKRSILW